MMRRNDHIVLAYVCFLFGGVPLGVGVGLFSAKGAETIKTYQPLIAAFFALVSAGLALWFVQRQIENTREIGAKQREQARELADENTTRKRQAVRAVLPLALNKITKYASDCLRVLREVRLANPENRYINELPDAVSDIDDIPDDAIKTVKECIEFAEKDVSEYVVKLLLMLQIQSARFESTYGYLKTKGVSGSSVYGHNIDSGIRDTLEIYIIASRIYEYARKKTTQLNMSISGDELTRRALFANFDEHTFSDLFKLLALGGHLAPSLDH